MRRFALSRKSRRLTLLRWIAVLAPLTGLLAGCSGADNPKIVEAPPPPTPKAEQLTPPPNIANKKTQYGTSSKYQKAMEGIDKE